MSLTPKKKFSLLQWWGGGNNSSSSDSRDVGESSQELEAISPHPEWSQFFDANYVPSAPPLEEATIPQIALHLRVELVWRIQQGVIHVSPEQFFHSISAHSPHPQGKTNVIMLGLAFALMSAKSEEISGGLRILRGSIKIDLKFGVEGSFDPVWFAKELHYEDSMETVYHDWEGELSITGSYRPSQGDPLNLGLYEMPPGTKALFHKHLDMLRVPFGEEPCGRFYLKFP